MSDSDLLQLYLDYLTAEVRLSENTLQAYRRDLQGFLQTRRERTDGPLAGLGREDILDFLEAIRSRGAALKRARCRNESCPEGYEQFERASPSERREQIQ